MWLSPLDFCLISSFQFSQTALIKAVEDFHERILPLFAKVDIQSHQIIVLREDFLESRQKTESLQDQVIKAQSKSIQLEMELGETKKNGDEAIRLAEIAKNELVEVRENLIQWKKRASELTAENKRYKDLLEKNVESVSHILEYSYTELVLSILP